MSTVYRLYVTADRFNARSEEPYTESWLIEPISVTICALDEQGLKIPDDTILSQSSFLNHRIKLGYTDRHLATITLTSLTHVPRVGPGHPSSPLSIYFLIFSPFYFSFFS